MSSLSPLHLLCKKSEALVHICIMHHLYQIHTFTQQSCRNSKVEIDEMTRFSTNFLCECGQVIYPPSVTIWVAWRKQGDMI